MVLAVPADIERYNTDRIACDQIAVATRVVEHEGKDPIHAIQELARLRLVIEVEDDLAIGGGLKIVPAAKSSAQVLVVINLAVHGEDIAVQRVYQRLRPMLDVDDREPLVGEYRVFVRVDAAPIGAAVAKFLGHGEREPTQFSRVGTAGLYVQNGENAAHKDCWVVWST